MTVAFPTASARRFLRHGPAGLLAALLALAAAPTSAQAASSETHVEYDLSHTERIAGVNQLLNVTNLPAGIDGTTSANDTDSIDGTFGDHTVSVSASVGTQNGLTRLRARGEHEYELSGTNPTTDHWRLVDGEQLLRATHIDTLHFNSAPFVPLTVEMYWDVRGNDDVLIDLLPSQSVVMNFHTDVSLTATTAAPNSGGGGYVETVPWPGGLRTTDLNQTKEVEPDEEFVVMTFTVQPGTDLDVETTFEVAPDTLLNNIFEGFAVSTTVEGHHKALFDQSAVLVGVIVRDPGGFVLPGISIVADSGNVYPVLDQVPVPPQTFKVIRSPVAVQPTALGEFGPSSLLTNMINQSGLVKSFSSGVTSFDHYMDFNPSPLSSSTFTNNWQSLVQFVLPLTGNVDFDLGGPQAIDRVALWNLSLQNIRLQIADSPGGPFTEIGAYVLPNRLAFLSYSPEVLNLGGTFTASYLRIAIDSAYKFAPSDTFTYAIVGEVAVSATPVPEPEAALMWAAGVPALLLLARRRARRIRRS